MGRKKKTIYNPHTGVRYQIRQRSTVAGAKGTIKGKYRRPQKKKGFWDWLTG